MKLVVAFLPWTRVDACGACELQGVQPQHVQPVRASPAARSYRTAQGISNVLLDSQ